MRKLLKNLEWDLISNDYVFIFIRVIDVGCVGIAYFQDWHYSVYDPATETCYLAFFYDINSPSNLQNSGKDSRFV